MSKTTPTNHAETSIKKDLSRRTALKGLSLSLASSFVAVKPSYGADTEASFAPWSGGGTAAMLDAANYPDPFQTQGSICNLTCQLIQGPCWAPSAPFRQDISEGEPGIPMRMAFQLVQDDGCSPVVGAEIEIWYCNVDGKYSGHDVEVKGFCTANNTHALENYFFRGRAVTDAQGKVIFDGCYPGWYTGRSVHVHLMVRKADHLGESSSVNAVATTQLLFPEAVTKDIFASHEDYLYRGQPDTISSTDNVLFGLDDVEPYYFEIDQMQDGAMLAWKTIVISDSEQCGSTGFPGGPGGDGSFGRPEGGGPPGGFPGGPPPGGFPGGPPRRRGDENN